MPASSAVSAVSASLLNGGALPTAKIPVVDGGSFREFITAGCESGGRLVSLFAEPMAGGGARLTAAVARAGRFGLLSCDVQGSYPSLTPDVPQAHLFEREVFEQWSVRPQGHPWLKPVRFHAPYASPGSGAPGPGEMSYFRVEGEEVHEVAVGPVHAGVIEPGHFRFQCHGETVLHLEISLGYQHRGVERAMAGGPSARSLMLAQTAAGDTSVAHATAYSMIVEALTGALAAPRGVALRTAALELERAANHVGDLAALAGDIAFLPTASWCGRLRGDFLNITAELCGSRLGRGVAAPGGALVDVDRALADDLRARTAQALSQAREAADLLWSTGSVRDRFEGTGVLPRDDCEALGIVGVAARACGVARDARREFPYGAHLRSPIESRIWPTGDVQARARVRWMEVEQSCAYVDRLLDRLPEEPARCQVAPPGPNMTAVAVTEGWRGEVVHLARTGPDGLFTTYKIVDPSFHNWAGLALAMRGAPISDFPLVNKSFNLSYCGHDL